MQSAVGYRTSRRGRRKPRKATEAEKLTVDFRKRCEERLLLYFVFRFFLCEWWQMIFVRCTMFLMRVNLATWRVVEPTETAVILHWMTFTCAFNMAHVARSLAHAHRKKCAQETVWQKTLFCCGRRSYHQRREKKVDTFVIPHNTTVTGTPQSVHVYVRVCCVCVCVRSRRCCANTTHNDTLSVSNLLMVHPTQVSTYMREERMWKAPWEEAPIDR